MKKTSDQLDTVFQEVFEYFRHTPNISITSEDSTPSSQYIITYGITGVCKDHDSEVYSCDNHRISISLPFGFPHFPPNCIPESPTFHPDFDASAISIDEIWESDNSLITLILHIGKMIAGEIYSENNAFNEEASEWYKNNNDRLPFDTTDAGQPENDIQPPAEPDDNLPGIDTLDDDDFGLSFSLENESAFEEVIDTDNLHLKIKQKQFQSLFQELESLPEDFEGRKEIQEQTEKAMSQAMALYKEADEIEHQGNPKEALEKYLAVENLVADYPMLQEAKERVQQAYDLLGDWSATSKEDDTNSSDSVSDIEESKPQDDGPRTTATKTFFEDKKAVSKKWGLFALGGATLALGVALAVTYFSQGSNLQRANELYSECRKHLNTNKFREAETKCTQALKLSTDIKIIKQSEKENLTKKIQAILSSPKLRQGLAGKTLVAGKYVSQSTKKQLLDFKKTKKEADTFFEKMHWDAAADSYLKTLNIAKTSNSIAPTVLVQIRQKSLHAQFNSLVQTGEETLSASHWKSANQQFNKALKLTEGNVNITPEDVTRLKSLLKLTKFNAIQAQGHEFFNASEWDSALINYKQALNLTSSIDQISSYEINSLNENIAKTEIYMAIEKGKNAFDASQWNNVIRQYEKALILLNENSHVLSKIDTEKSRTKLSRIILHTEIIQDKQDVVKYLKSEDYSAVIQKLVKIEQSIINSNFAGQEEFKIILEETRTQVDKAKAQLLLTKQSTYLSDNYKVLFLKHYPSAIGPALSAPAVEFLRNIDSKLLFRMQCTETSGGRSLRLQMDYLYSPDSKKWNFYSEE